MPSQNYRPGNTWISGEKDQLMIWFLRLSVLRMSDSRSFLERSPSALLYISCKTSNPLKTSAVSSLSETGTMISSSLSSDVLCSLIISTISLLSALIMLICVVMLMPLRRFAGCTVRFLVTFSVTGPVLLLVFFLRSVSICGLSSQLILSLINPTN